MSSSRSRHHACRGRALIPRLIPGRTALVAIAASAIAVFVGLLAGLSPATALRLAIGVLAGLTVATGLDYIVSRRTWRLAPPTMTRHLPAAFAIGVSRDVRLTIQNSGGTPWHCALHDFVDPTFQT